MALHDYVCSVCGHIEESFEDLNNVTHCKFSDGKPQGLYQKQLSPPNAFIMKGQGTYDKGWVSKK